MSPRRYALRKDENQTDIVKALESTGCDVWILHQPVDLLVARAGVNYLLEVKNPKKPKSGRKHTPAQVKFFREWQGQKATVETTEQALAAVGVQS